MSIPDEAFTIGVEEEYQIIDPQTRQLQSDAQAILRRARAAVGDQVTPELYRSQIEIGTPICQTLSEVRHQLRYLRGELISAAHKAGNRIVAAGTHPFSHWEDQRLTRKERYIELAADYRQLVREQLIFGCHVHVGIPDREVAIQVMNRSRPWLASLLALAANSPFWLGTETGYASFRTEIWGRWPTAGIPQAFESRAAYDQLVDELTATGIIDDASKIYWDVRPSSHYETLEFRVTDVCLTIDEGVLIAGLIRALARTCAWEAERDAVFRPVRPEVLQAAKWQAARFGLDQTLIDAQAGRAIPAREMIDQFLAYVRPALETYSDWDELSALVDAVFAGGTGAARQRAAYARNENFDEVVDFMADETAKDAFMEGAQPNPNALSG